jgi:hypothetical protein
MDLVPPNARIEAQYVVGKRRELTDELHADQSAADHHDRQTRTPMRRVAGCVRPFEALDQLIPEHQRVGHRLECQRVR